MTPLEKANHLYYYGNSQKTVCWYVLCTLLECIKVCCFRSTKAFLLKKQKNTKKFQKGVDKRKYWCYIIWALARVAESADAHVWGACGNPVRVQVPSLAPKMSSHISVDSFFCCQKIGRDLNPLAEGEHNRVFASETQRMMGRAHQVPSLAPKKATPKRVSFFFWCSSIRLRDFYFLRKWYCYAVIFG